MDINVIVKDDVTVVYIGGKLDATTSTKLEQELAPIIDGINPMLILDFSDLTYISSAGLRILLKAAKQIKAKQGSFILCSMKDFIREVFDVSGFSSILTTVESCEQALLTIKK